MPPLLSLRAFEAAARLMSFQKAASELGVSPTAVSHQIKILENNLGFPLFVRHTRNISLTSAGEKLWPALNVGFSTFQTAIDSLFTENKRKVITLTAPALFTAKYLIPYISEFETIAGEYELRLHTSDELVDLSTDAADIAVRCGDMAPYGFHTEDLITDSYGVICSPELGIKKYEDLMNARLLISEHKAELHSPGWKRWALEAGVTWLNLDKGIRFSDEGYAIQAAISGQGVMIGSMLLTYTEIQNGLLVNPFGPILPGSIYRIVASQKNYQREGVRKVVQWLHRCVEKNTR